VVASNGGQRRRAAVAAVHLPHAVKSSEHGKSFAAFERNGNLPISLPQMGGLDPPCC
jgi:hypothetical protein